MLPYYKIQKTEEDKRFFFWHEGYFNFWDEYLICNINTNEKLFWVIVNRTGYKFSNPKPSNIQRVAFNLMFEQSIREKVPEEMFVDFPELEKLRDSYLKELVWKENI